MQENESPSPSPSRSAEASSRTEANRAVLITRQIAELPFLPPAFEIIPRLLVLLDDPEGNSDALADLIHVDPGLTANVLHIANSAFYGRGTRTETLLEAVNRVGLREIYRITMAIVASPVLAHAEQSGFARVDLWTHSLAAAVAGQILALQTGTEDTEVTFTAALLHDTGKVIIAHALGDEYLSLLEASKEQKEPLHIAEERAFKTNHAEVGAKLLKRWNFPENIISAVERHHCPSTPPPTHPRLAALVYAANILAHRIGTGYGFPDYAVEPDPAELRLIDLDSKALFAYEDEVKLALERAQGAFRT